MRAIRKHNNPVELGADMSPLYHLQSTTKQRVWAVGNMNLFRQLMNNICGL